MQDAMEDEAQPVSVLRRTFEQRYAYRKRLKQLPSQKSRTISPASSSTSLSSQHSGQGTSGSSDKVNVDDALKIFEEMLADREETLRNEFKEEVQKQLSEQYDQLMRYNEEYVRSQISSSSCSYLS